MFKKLLIILIFVGAMLGIEIIQPPLKNTIADDCLDLQIVFARGSGEIWQENESFLAFKTALEPKLSTTDIKYQITDLNYPAIAVGLGDNFWTSVGAFVSGGKSYRFGESVNSGVETLTHIINHSCPNTKHVLAGYSQGAMVISKALPNFNPNQIIFAATFGDPKLYLPEGAGLFPAACRNQNLSTYRFYVPDCHAYEGLLGGLKPYVSPDFDNKVGTWCNKKDIMCSSGLSINDHTTYVAENLYEDASKVIFNKIAAHFSLKNTPTNPHDTAILIDSTGSMKIMIDKYKAEALRLATKTIDSGGRVALYDYRDLDDPYVATKHCDFNTCTLEIFQQELDNILTGGGGDDPESLLSSSLKVMRELNWQTGATKSLIILTDSDFLLPDRDGTTLEDVVKLSQSIDPVNFYVIAHPNVASAYTELTTLTDGKIETDFDKLTLLTDYIMERYDSLPRVETETSPSSAPIQINHLVYTKNLANQSVYLTFETAAKQVIIILNDTPLGTTTLKTLTIKDIDFTKDNSIRLIPIDDNLKGVPADIVIPKNLTLKSLPDVPNTGQI